MQDNPFTQIDSRFNRLEDLISQLIHKLDRAPSKQVKDVGGINVAVEETSYSVSTIYKLVSNGAIPVIKKRGRLYFSRKALQQWIMTNGP